MIYLMCSILIQIIIVLEDFSYRIMNSYKSKTVKIEYVETWGWLAWIRILTEKEEKF